MCAKLTVMSKQVYKKAEFARLAGVSRAAVTQAVRTGYIIAEDGLVDITHPKNASYLASNRSKRPKLTEPEDTEVVEEETNFEPPELDAELEPPKKKRRKRKPRGYDPATDTEILTKEAADIRRINAQTANLKLKYAERLKDLVLRKDVDRVFQNIYSVAINYFLVLGDRLSPVLASLCGISDQKIVIEMKDRIDKEVSRALDELKRQTETEL